MDTTYAMINFHFDDAAYAGEYIAAAADTAQATAMIW